MALWVLSRCQLNFFQILPQVPQSRSLIQMIEFIENIDPANHHSNYRNQWNKAKEKFILDIMDPQMRPPVNIYGEMDFYGSEYGKFIVHLANFQLHDVRQICTINCPNDGAIIRRNEHAIYLNKVNNNVVLQSMWTGLCSQCRMHFDTMVEFGQNNPNFLIIQTIHRVIEYHEMPDTIIIDNRTFKLICATIHDQIRAHFVSIIKINESSYFIDGKGRVVDLLPAFNQNILNRRRLAGPEKYYKMFISSSLYFLI